MLRGAAHLTLPHQFDQLRFRQLGDVVVRVAEGDLQLAAEIAGGEDAAAVEAENFEDRDAKWVRRSPRQPLPVDGNGPRWSPVFRCIAPDLGALEVTVGGV